MRQIYYCTLYVHTDMVFMTLVLLQADQRVMRHLIISYLPDIDLVLKEHDIGIDVYICIKGTDI